MLDCKILVFEEVNADTGRGANNMVAIVFFKHP